MTRRACAIGMVWTLLAGVVAGLVLWTLFTSANERGRAAGEIVRWLLQTFGG